VSKFLTEPSLLPFYYALFFAKQRVIRNPRFKYEYGRDMLRFDLKPGGINYSDCVRTWEAFKELTACVRWRFGTIDTYATTENDRTSKGATQILPGLPDRGRTRGASVTLSADYLDVFRLDLGLPPSNSRFSTEPPPTPSSIMRTRFHFAKILLHELCHVIKWATTPWPASSMPPCEPFFSDHWKAELGNAFESLVFGGVVNPLDDEVSALSGLGLYKWPCIWPTGDVPKRGVNNRSYTTIYAVPMAWVAAWWTERHWADIRQMGVGAAISVDRSLGYREYEEGRRSEEEYWESDTSNSSISINTRMRRERWKRRRDMVYSNALFVDNGKWSTTTDSSDARNPDENGIIKEVDGMDVDEETPKKKEPLDYDVETVSPTPKAIRYMPDSSTNSGKPRTSSRQRSSSRRERSRSPSYLPEPYRQRSPMR